MPKSTRAKEDDELTKFECTIAAILTVAAMNGRSANPELAYETYGDIVQMIRGYSGGAINPPTHGTLRN